MKYFFKDNANNSILSTDVPEGKEYIIVPNEFSLETHYVKDGVVKEKGTAPNDNSEFDEISEQWVSIYDLLPFEEYLIVATNKLKEAVSAARQQYITSLPGQDAIYQAKENEAIQYLAETSPTLADYPLLNAETGTTAPTATELANLWISMAQQWRSVAAQLEAARMTANASIGSATTVAGVDVALAALDAAIAGLPQP